MIQNRDLRPDEEVIVCGASLPGVRAQLANSTLASGIRATLARAQATLNRFAADHPDLLPVTERKWSDRHADNELRRLGDLEERRGRKVSPRVLRTIWAAAEARNVEAFELAVRAADAELAGPAPGMSAGDHSKHVEDLIQRAEDRMKRAGGAQ